MVCEEAVKLAKQKEEEKEKITLCIKQQICPQCAEELSLYPIKYGCELLEWKCNQCGFRYPTQ